MICVILFPPIFALPPYARIISQIMVTSLILIICHSSISQNRIPFVDDKAKERNKEAH
jgi:hypothetical protein